ncbi:diaminopimelate decarboxylase family protein [Streptomyces zagrosensis]|uniref:Diaminopimelate decarboxylase n=1 Tax=Streptomyces zagrosensis TaxID=1042984 RepID=A0A7W9V2T7_9ACTN|nr:alanine racemase [Streptomyces zagrosensis]MBB5940307.1 diaminopimelate decarboxylase [Streptomyces zagrosensis]
MSPTPDAFGPGASGAPDLAALGARWGTPLYVLDLDRLRANLTRLARELAPDTTLYSLKTNHLPAVTEVVREHGFGVDVVSGYELRAALRAGFAPERIVFNGPVKTAEELREAASRGVYVNIDGEEEIDTVAESAGARGEPLPVGLRVFPPQDVYAGPPPLPRRTTPSKFGWPLASGDADRLVKAIQGRPELRLTGLHCHLGSQITSVPALLEALESVIVWAAATSQTAPLELLNLGGGFGVPGIRRFKGAVAGLSQIQAAREEPAEQERFTPARLAAGVRDLLGRHGLAHLRVCWEPGRAVVSDAMTLLTRVAAVKRTAPGTWVLLDGGLNLLPTAGVAERHRYEALRSETPDASYFLGGPLCYEGDVFSLDARLPQDIRRGDFVAVRDAGAYSITRATSFNQPRAAVVAVSGGDAALVWRAETDDDIFQFAQQPGETS